jgi:hypothetical protein
MKSLNKHTKEEIIEACKRLFNLACSLKEYSDRFTSELAQKDFECNLQNEFFNREKERVEQNYCALLGEHQLLEISFQELQQKYLQLGHEARELGMKVSHSELQQDCLLKNIEDLKSILISKDRQISDLNKRIKINISLKNLAERKPKDCLTPKHSISSSLKNPTGSVTPISTKFFDLEKIMENDGIKDQVIKNLKKQLNDSILKSQDLKQELAEMSQANQALMEQACWLNTQRHRFCEDDEESRFDTLESLRDEIAVIDSEFILSSRQSVRSSYKGKEVGVQVEVPQMKKKKSRYSCFSFFD